MARRKSDVIFIKPGHEVKTKLLKAKQITKLSQNRIVSDGIERELQVLARRFPKLREWLQSRNNQAEETV